MFKNSVSTNYKLSITELLFWVIRKRQRYNIVGSSMWPTFRENQDVLVKSYNKIGDLSIGDVVVAVHPRDDNFLVVKKVAKINQNNDKYFLSGENISSSTDSRSFGWIVADNIIGKVTAVLG